MNLGEFDDLDISLQAGKTANDTIQYVGTGATPRAGACLDLFTLRFLNG